MTSTIIISGATLLLLTLSILLLPTVKIGRTTLDTYWIAAALGALILIISGLVPIGELWSQLTQNSDVNPLKILALFFSMTFLSVFLDEAGLFRYLANRAVKVAKNNQLSLFLVLYALTATLTVFTSNDIVILTFTPFICFFCKNAGLNPVPYLVSEFAAANTWSMMLIIGNPTNIYLATSAGISFTDYVQVMLLPTIAAGAVEICVILLMFGRQLKKPLVQRADDFGIKSKADLYIGLSHLAVCLVFLVISGYIHVPMWIVSCACAVSLFTLTVSAHILLHKRNGYLASSVKRLPWALIPFVLSMFVIVIALNYSGASEKIGALLSKGNTVFTYGSLSYLSANLVNNIPMSILFSGLPAKLAPAQYAKAIYASTIGSNIGAFLTPIGALAGIMFTGLTKKHDVNFGFSEFIKYGAIISIPTIAAALFVLGAEI